MFIPKCLPDVSNKEPFGLNKISNCPCFKHLLCLLNLLLIIVERALQKYVWVQIFGFRISLLEKKGVLNVISPPLSMDRTPTSKKAPDIK